MQTSWFEFVFTTNSSCNHSRSTTYRLSDRRPAVSNNCDGVVCAKKVHILFQQFVCSKVKLFAAEHRDVVVCRQTSLPSWRSYASAIDTTCCCTYEANQVYAFARKQEALYLTPPRNVALRYRWTSECGNWL